MSIKSLLYSTLKLTKNGIIARHCSDKAAPWEKIFDSRKCIYEGLMQNSKSNKTFDVHDPATGEHIYTVPWMTMRELDSSINEAYDGQKLWAKINPTSRSRFLSKWADSLEKHKWHLAQLISKENGKLIPDALGEIASAIHGLRWYSEEAKRIYGRIIPSHSSNDRKLLTISQPVGVVGVITPWNFPLSMITRKVGAAFGAGCAVVVKPAADTPMSAIAAAYLAIEEAGLPPELFSVFTCPNGEAAEEVGQMLCNHPKIAQIGFTGSSAVGKLLYEQAGAHVKRVNLELGGNAPFIVFDSADIPSAMRGLIASKFRCSGQTCISADRIFVHEKVHDLFVQSLMKELSKWKLGSGNDRRAQQGPLINPQAVERVHAAVKDDQQAGAVVLLGGKHLDRDGYFYPVTLMIDCKPHMKCVKYENFGPVVPIIKFANEEEVVEMANDTKSGLAGYFYSNDPSQIWRVAEQLQVGMVGVNDWFLSTVEAPFGGVKESGIGHEGGPHALQEFMNLKYICWSGNPG